MEAGNYTGLQADIFAAGVVLFIMYNGTPPFLSTKVHDRIYRLIREKNFPKFWALHEKNKPAGFYPDSFKRLINSFLSAEADRRPSFESLESDEWMKGDDLMGNEIFEYMKVKAEKMAEKDENKRKITALRKDLYVKKSMEEDCCEGEYRGEEDEENLSEEGLFLKNYRNLNIEV
jgi:serine/threonine protein kinase